MTRVALTEAQRENVVTMRNDNVPRSDVARWFKVNEATISRITTKFKRTQDLSVAPSGCGTEETDKLLDATITLLDENPSITLQEIADNWKNEHGVKRTKRTVCNFLKRHGLESDYRKRENRSTSADQSDVRKTEQCEGQDKKKVKEAPSFAGFLTRKRRKQIEAKLRRRAKLDRRTKLRLRALLLLNEGHSVKDAAAKVGASGRSVRNWYKLYVEAGLQRIIPERGLNISRCKLNLEQVTGVYEYVCSNPRIHIREIRYMIRSAFKVKYSISGARMLVRALGFRFKRSRVIPRVPDAAVQSKWVDRFHWRLASMPKGSVFLFADGVHTRHRGETGGCWVLQDAVPVIQQASGRLGANIMAALNPETGELFYVEADKINGDVLLKLFQILKDRYPNAPRIYVILDNAGYHKSKNVNNWLKSQPRTKEGLRMNWILPYFLPPYCPHLNKIERLWRMLRKNVTENRVQENLEEFLKEVRAFLDSVEQCWDEYKDYVDAKFRIIEPKQYQVIS